MSIFVKRTFFCNATGGGGADFQGNPIVSSDIIPKCTISTTTPASKDDELKYWVIGDEDRGIGEEGIVGEMQERKELERLEQWL